MANPKPKKIIGFIELPDEALDLFGLYAQRPNWEVGLVVSLDGQSYAARMASILKVPLLDRPNRPTLVECNRVIVGKKPGLRAMVQELVEDTRVEVIPVEDAMRDLAARNARVAKSTGTASGGARPSRERAKEPSQPPALEISPEKKPSGKNPAGPYRGGKPSLPSRPRRPAEEGERRAPRPTFDAGTILGADFRSKLQALPIDDGDRLLREILELAVKVTRADSGSIMLVDDTGSHLRIAVADGLPEWVVEHTRQEVGTGIAGTVFDSGQPRLVHGHVAGPETTSPEVRPGLRDAACVPIPGKEGPVGVLNLNVESEGTRFDRNTLALLKLFAREASGAVVRAVNLRRLTGTMQREVAIRQIERLMSLQEPVASRLHSVADVIGQTLCADYSHCLVTDPERTHLVATGIPQGMGILGVRRQPIDLGFAGWALRQGTPTVLEAGSSRDRAALAYLPLVGGRPYGMLVLERIPLERISSVQVLQFLTEAKEIVEALLALEEATEDLDADFPPGRASA